MSVRAPPKSYRTGFAVINRKSKKTQQQQDQQQQAAAASAAEKREKRDERRKRETSTTKIRREIEGCNDSIPEWRDGTKKIGP